MCDGWRMPTAIQGLEDIVVDGIRARGPMTVTAVERAIMDYNVEGANPKKIVASLVKSGKIVRHGDTLSVGEEPIEIVVRSVEREKRLRQADVVKALVAAGHTKAKAEAAILAAVETGRVIKEGNVLVCPCTKRAEELVAAPEPRHMNDHLVPGHVHRPTYAGDGCAVCDELFLSTNAPMANPAPPQAQGSPVDVRAHFNALLDVFSRSRGDTRVANARHVLSLLQAYPYLNDQIPNDVREMVQAEARTPRNPHERELFEMEEIARRHGVVPEDAWRLHAEGMGPTEFEQRARVGTGGVGSLEYTHNLQRGSRENPAHEDRLPFSSDQDRIQRQGMYELERDIMRDLERPHGQRRVVPLGSLTIDRKLQELSDRGWVVWTRQNANVQSLSDDRYELTSHGRMANAADREFFERIAGRSRKNPSHENPSGPGWAWGRGRQPARQPIKVPPAAVEFINNRIYDAAKSQRREATLYVDTNHLNTLRYFRRYANGGGGAAYSISRNEFARDLEVNYGLDLNVVVDEALDAVMTPVPGSMQNPAQPGSRPHVVVTRWYDHEGAEFKRGHQRVAHSKQAAVDMEVAHNQQRAASGMTDDGWQWQILTVDGLPWMPGVTPPPAPRPGKVGVHKIVVQRVEGRHAPPADNPEQQTFTAPHAWAKADAFLRQQARTAPDTGGYDKCDFVVVFDDDETYRGRYDLIRRDVSSPDILSAHVLHFLRFLTGRHKPEHMSQQQYDDYIANNAKRGHTVAEVDAYMAKYDLGPDSVAAISPAPMAYVPPAPPAPPPPPVVSAEDRAIADDVNATAKEIARRLKARSGKTWSVTRGRGTSHGWLTISVPPARYGKHGSDGISEEDRAELKRLLGVESVQYQGHTVPSSTNHRIEYLQRAAGQTPTVWGQQYWD